MEPIWLYVWLWPIPPCHSENWPSTGMTRDSYLFDPFLPSPLKTQAHFITFWINKTKWLTHCTKQNRAFEVTLLITQTIIFKGVGSTNISVFSNLISSGTPVKYKDSHAALPILPLAASSWMPHSLTFYFDILVYFRLALMWNTLPLWLCNRLGRVGGTP